MNFKVGDKVIIHYPLSKESGTIINIGQNKDIQIVLNECYYMIATETYSSWIPESMLILDNARMQQEETKKLLGLK